MPAIALDRTPAYEDTDRATRQTVEKMCELIRASIGDPQADPTLQNIAADIKRRYCWNSCDPGALAFGVFWWVKHHITFRSDEGTMFQIGERNQQDLLIRPDILVKMEKPSEDCDGFTMLTAALLTILQVPVVIATVAVDLDDPTRWSHVFLCAIVNGRVMPLDTSHGNAPGWMVPRNRINRWQTWTLDGRPADVQIPTYHGLNGYSIAGVGQVRRLPVPLVRRRMRAKALRRAWGRRASVRMKLVNTVSHTTTPGYRSAARRASLEVLRPDRLSVEYCDVGWTLTGPGVCSQAVGGATKPAGSPNYAALVSSIANAASTDIKAVIQQPQALLSAQTWANLSAYLPIIGVGLLGFLIVTSLAGGKK